VTAQVLEFVKEAIASKTPGNKRWLDYRTIDEREAALLEKNLGQSFLGWTRSIDESAVKHIWAGHGAGNEKDGRLVALTPEDIAKIPEITTSPDNVHLDRDRKGRDLICYEKQYHGKVFLFEERRFCRRKLVPVTMRIVKSKG
jgi:hypothetical protein